MKHGGKAHNNFRLTTDTVVPRNPQIQNLPGSAHWDCFPARCTVLNHGKRRGQCMRMRMVLQYIRACAGGCAVCTENFAI